VQQWFNALITAGLVFAFVLGRAGGAVRGEEAGEKAAQEQELKQDWACIADAQKLCPGTKPGAGRVIACLRTYMSDLSEACKQEIRPQFPDA
jgi:hypothetical protein